MKAFDVRQRGISFWGFLMLAMGVIFVAILGMKVVPAYVHSVEIRQVLVAMANDPELQNAQANVIKMAFEKRASINFIEDITGNDLEIAKTDGKLSLSVSYVVRIPLVANMILLLEFNPSSS